MATRPTSIPQVRCTSTIPPALAAKLAPMLRRAHNLGTGISGTRGAIRQIHGDG